MSKSYKLIKEYPGSPKLGTTLPENATINGNIFYDKESNPNRLYVDKFPKFWKKILEKDYEILSFIVNQSKGVLIVGDIVTKVGDGFKGTSSHNRGIIAGDSENEFLSKDHWSIHSVKRLSDGEVFTIGDNCEFGILTRIFLIKYINGKDIIMTSTKNSNYSCNILYLKKLKQPLFTTEDGVEIFEGDNIYTVHLDDWTIEYFEKLNKLDFTASNDKDFSTKEKAEEYIIMNKPCLSINDIKKTMDVGNLDTGDLKSLVKQKVGL